MPKIQAMERRDFLKTTLLSATAVGLGFSPLQTFGAVDYKLTILHTNDTHSRIEPFPETGNQWKGLGGMARRAALVQKIRREAPNVLLLDAGDIFQGTPYFNFFGGELEYKLMSQMGYDATTMGNHDFDLGLTGFVKQQPNAKFDVLVANYDFSKTIVKGLTKPYKIYQKGAIKVGVFGLGIELNGLVPTKLYGDTVWQPPIPVAKEMVQELKAKGCHLIICLSHLGYEYADKKFVSDHDLAQVEGIDIIIGGHSHTLLSKPTEIQQAHGHKVIVNQVGWAGICLGRIDVSFTTNMAKKSVAYHTPILIDGKC